MWCIVLLKVILSGCSTPFQPIYLKLRELQQGNLHCAYNRKKYKAARYHVTMEKLVRFGVSMPASLLEQFDKIIALKGYANRSEAIRDMIRNIIVEHEWLEGKEVIGTITLVYDHHKKSVMGNLVALQHAHHSKIASSTHIHLDHENCLEVIVVRGKSSAVKELADNMIALKGVKHGKLVITSPLNPD